MDLIVLIAILLVCISCLVYKTIKTRKLCKLCLCSRRKLMKDGLPVAFAFGEIDLRKDLLKKPFLSFCKIINASSACYFYVHSEEKLQLSFYNGELNEYDIEKLCNSFYFSKDSLTIQDVNIDNVLQKTICHKVIIDNCIVGIACFFLKNIKYFLMKKPN